MSSNFFSSDEWRALLEYAGIVVVTVPEPEAPEATALTLEGLRDYVDKLDDETSELRDYVDQLDDEAFEDISLLRGTVSELQQRVASLEQSLASLDEVGIAERRFNTGFRSRIINRLLDLEARPAPKPTIWQRVRNWWHSDCCDFSGTEYP